MGAPLSACKEATPRQIKLLEMPTVEGHFPFVFKDSGFKVEKLDFACNVCDAKMYPRDVRGIVSNVVPRVLDLDLVGVCPKCGINTPFRVRLHSDQMYDWQDDSGEWHRSKVYAGSLNGIRMAFKDMFAALKALIMPGRA
ncbi:hypothetical protein FY034_17790 (plasmid) [Trichlorobacter lovleyi]|uniref:hypothetical protein n=1 Tax=Trichlorobacter lovleyi TaxID=313985 RepID=UPI00223F38B8|nr:hypothetical protein [Trichlorobacter lovleyi]QOX80875.1 hypothetical protein FY034_17790 [Trichlorobacter lovleyi]